MNRLHKSRCAILLLLSCSCIPMGFSQQAGTRNPDRQLKRVVEPLVEAHDGDVSCAQQDDDELFVVVLGSSSSDARYADTRNLYRWRWRQNARPECPSK